MQTRFDYLQASFFSFLIHAILFLYLIGFFYTEKQIRPILSKAVSVNIIVDEINSKKIDPEVIEIPQAKKQEVISSSTDNKLDFEQPSEQAYINDLQSLIKQESDIADLSELEKNIAHYSFLMIKLIEDAWIKPKNIQDGLKCDIKIKTNVQGRIVSINLIKSSGNIRFDNSALQAVKRVETFSFFKELNKDIYDDIFKNITISFNPSK